MITKRLVLRVCIPLLVGAAFVGAALVAGAGGGATLPTATTPDNGTVPPKQTTVPSTTTTTAPSLQDWMADYAQARVATLSQQLEYCENAASRATEQSAGGGGATPPGGIANCDDAMAQVQSLRAGPLPPASSAQGDWQAYLGDVSSAVNLLTQAINDPSNGSFAEQAKTDVSDASSQLSALNAVAAG